jgi:hypothetical protein
MDIEHTAQLDHVALAVIEKDADGKLKTDRHDTSAKHLAWGGGILGEAPAAISARLWCRCDLCIAIGNLIGRSVRRGRCDGVCRSGVGRS